jgi:carboxylesterase type B
MSTTTWNETLDNLKILWPSATSAFFARLEQLYPLSAFDAVYFNDRFFSSPTIKYLSQTLNHSVESNLEYWRAQQIYGDFIIKCPTYYQAVALSELDRPLPVFKLIFNTGTEVHGATVPFLTTPPHENENPELARKMLDYWISFTATLDPSASSYPNTGRPEWPRYSVSNQKFSVLEVNGTEIGVRPDSDASERCDFLYRRSREVLN